MGPVAVRWRLNEMASYRKSSTGTDPEPAGLLDLSVTGARIMARSADDIAVGSRTNISIRGATGPVIVRRISPAAQSGFSHYGLEFLDPLSPLTQLVHTELAQRPQQIQ